MGISFGVPRGQFSERHTAGLGANAVVNKGDALMINAAGFAVRCVVGTAGTPCGFAREAKDNTGGADNALRINFDSGKALVLHDGSITAAANGTTCTFSDHLNVVAGAPAAGEPGGVVYVDPSTDIANSVWVLIKYGN